MDPGSIFRGGHIQYDTGLIDSQVGWLKNITSLASIELLAFDDSETRIQEATSDFKLRFSSE